ncbi:hypothetical protein AB0A05_07295 [Streptomyces sp. NPDC046374]|uniref:hypothetical protein n=1 Tax=Streptomyces sp. NPDC046374 TaxID=3154917 RepID=UPI0033D37E7B
MADCMHEIDLCPTCDGLRVTRLNPLPGVSSLQLADESSALVRQGATQVYIGPVPGPCPNEPKEEIRAGS